MDDSHYNARSTSLRSRLLGLSSRALLGALAATACAALGAACVAETAPEEAGDAEAGEAEETSTAESSLVLPGPVGLWTLDDCANATLLDSSGTGAHGARTGGSCTAGQNGQAISFDGAGSRVEIANTPAFNFTTSMTVAAWARPTSNLPGGRTIVNKWFALDSYGLWHTDGRYVFTIAVPGGQWGTIHAVSAPASLGAWTHVAGVYDGKKMTLYLNGVPAASRVVSSVPTALQGSSRPVVIGNHPDGAGFPGGIDDVRLYNVALGPEQIKSLPGMARVTRIGKVFGARNWSWLSCGVSWGLAESEPAGVSVFNEPLSIAKGIHGTDLGPMTMYKNRLFFNLGDTVVNPKVDPSQGACYPERDFVVAYSPSNASPNLDQGIALDGYLQCGAGCTQAPRALVQVAPNESTIPTGMFTVRDAGGNERMFGHYMLATDVSGNHHAASYSRLAWYDEPAGVFKPYKPNVYHWTGANRDFIQASFWVDTSASPQQIYMLGTAPGRFGGVKLARTPVATFLDANSVTGWSYYKADGTWTAATTDPNVISSAGWVIPPKDPAYSPAITYPHLCEDIYSGNGQPASSVMTVGEFSVVYNPWLRKYVLMTGRPCRSRDPANPAATDHRGGVYYYTASRLEGPWSDDKLLAPSFRQGTQVEDYGTYTTDALLRENGRVMHFVSTTFARYGVYQYKAELVCEGHPESFDAGNEGWTLGSGWSVSGWCSHAGTTGGLCYGSGGAGYPDGGLSYAKKSIKVPPTATKLSFRYRYAPDPAEAGTWDELSIAFGGTQLVFLNAGNKGDGTWKTVEYTIPASMRGTTQTMEALFYAGDGWNNNGWGAAIDEIFIGCE